jgi:hypothetical protein
MRGLQADDTPGVQFVAGEWALATAEPPVVYTCARGQRPTVQTTSENKQRLRVLAEHKPFPDEAQLPGRVEPEVSPSTLSTNWTHYEFSNLGVSCR